MNLYSENAVTPSPTQTGVQPVGRAHGASSELPGKLPFKDLLRARLGDVVDVATPAVIAEPPMFRPVNQNYQPGSLVFTQA